MWEKELRQSTNTSVSFEKFTVKNIQSMKQTKADQKIPSNHADAYPTVDITHTSNHFAYQFIFLPNAPSLDPFKKKYI